MSSFVQVVISQNEMKLLCSVENALVPFSLITSEIFRLQLHGAIYRPDSFILVLRYCANLKAIRYESTSLNRIVADKSHRVFVASRKGYFSLNDFCAWAACNEQNSKE